MILIFCSYSPSFEFQFGQGPAAVVGGGHIMGVPQTLTHVQSVRMLYKSVLRLHRGLPAELKALGDQYVRDEFRRHRDAPAREAGLFLQEWAGYALNLARQLGVRGVKGARPIGTHISEEQLDHLRPEQLVQLYELFQETQNPSRPPDSASD
ncbi:succinate dehydrogenase assembly factor 3, mitochondrial-like isoform X3 [Amphibalanus amphitrite]|uniref:succinate dehydrogenase assembly factor 3, mitochondrial-like isoform X3 n=2 Tax=Amphibalanus amphitrite TaxID=1232801 RepID=UPI001C920545|nr:succinate dehydrogenase assembly factor 3, mitochondrial-like isoform X3 [Amphibalanus amphitrite]